MIAELDTDCATATKKNTQGYKISCKGYKLHLDTACCGVPISAVLTGAGVHDSRVVIPLIRISAQRVDACYFTVDGAYCSTLIREEIQAVGRVPLTTTRVAGKSENLPRMKPNVTKHALVQNAAMRGSRMSLVPVMFRYVDTPR